MTRTPFPFADRLQRLADDLEREGRQARRDRARRRAQALAAEARLIAAEALGSIHAPVLRGRLLDIDTLDLLA